MKFPSFIIFFFPVLVFSENKILPKEYVQDLTKCLDDLEMGSCSSGLGAVTHDGYGRIAVLKMPGNADNEVIYFDYGMSGSGEVKICKPPVIDKRGPKGDRTYFFFNKPEDKQSRLGLHEEVFFNYCKNSANCPTQAKEVCRPAHKSERTLIKNQIRNFVIDRLETRASWLKDSCGRQSQNSGVDLNLEMKMQPYDQCVGTTKAHGFLMIHHPEGTIGDLKTDKEIRGSESVRVPNLNSVVKLDNKSAQPLCEPKSTSCQKINWGREVSEFSKVEKAFDVNCGFEQEKLLNSKRPGQSCTGKSTKARYCSEDELRMYFSGAQLFSQAQKCLGNNLEMQKSHLQAIRLMGGFQPSEGIGVAAQKDIEAHGYPVLADMGEKCKSFLNWAINDSKKCEGGKPNASLLGKQIIQTAAYLQLMRRDVRAQLLEHEYFGELNKLPGFSEKSESDFSLLSFQFGIGKVSRTLKRILVKQKMNIKSYDDLIQQLKDSFLEEIEAESKKAKRSLASKNRRKEKIQDGFAAIGPGRNKCFSK